MAAKKQKYYVVWEGNTPGIYDSWLECQTQISGYSGAKYKSFKTREEARNALDLGYELFQQAPKKSPKLIFKDEIELNSISVDAACSGNPGDVEYRGVITESGVEIFRQGPFAAGSNNIGEFLALVHCLALCKRNGENTKSIYSDSITAMSWVRKKKANTKLQTNTHNKILFELISRAEKWLKENPFKNPILKWNTKKWGEIPADFGRK